MNFGDTIGVGNNQGLIVGKTDHSCGFVSAVIALSILGNWFQRLLLRVPVGPWGYFWVFLCCSYGSLVGRSLVGCLGSCGFFS